MFARHFNRSPTLLGLDEIRGYQLHLVHEQKLSWGSFNQAVCALRFLYLKTLGKDWNIESIPFAKQPKKLPLVLSQDEVHAVLDAITNPQNRVIAITLYAAGLRAAAGCRKPVTPPAGCIWGRRVYLGPVFLLVFSLHPRDHAQANRRVAQAVASADVEPAYAEALAPSTKPLPIGRQRRGSGHSPCGPDCSSSS